MSGAESTGPDARRADFLSGVRILELGDGVAGAATTSLLWSLGAEVVTVVDVASTHRRGRPRTGTGPDGTSLLASVLDRGKHRAELAEGDALEAVLAPPEGLPFDLVVVDRVHGLRGRLAARDALDRYLDLVARHGHAAWLSISAFGLSGARAGDIGTELTVAAAGGMLSAVRDPGTGQPLKLAGQQSLLGTGQAGALAACHALALSAGVRGVHLDLSAVEATLAMGPVLEVGGLLLATGAVGGARRYGAPAGFFPCSDGRVRISAMEDHQWRGLVAAMGSPSWAERFATVGARIDAADDVDVHVGAWTRTRPKRDAEATLQAHGVPATAVYSPQEVLASPQLAHREAFEPLRLDGGRTAQVVGLPFRVVASGSRRRRRSLRGLRVLEASRVLAVPLAGALLGALGADVTKIEDLPRLDMYRRRGPYVDGEPGTERSAYFALMNHSKASAAFDVDADRDRLDALVAASDVVIENLGPKRASALGVAASVAPAAHPDLLVVSSTGFGQDGPHADFRAYAYNLQASCALGHLTRTTYGDSAEVDVAWADLISGYALATIIAAWAVGPDGNAGAGLDFAMADLVVAHFDEYLAAAALDGDAADTETDRANDLAPFAPHGVYPTADGWVALAVDGDEQHAALAAVLASDDLADPAWAGADARWAARRDVDEHVAAATGGRVAAELAAALRAAGVAAEEVVTAAGLVDDPQLAERGFFVPVPHPEWGPRRLVGLPWRPLGAAAIVLGAPPVLVPPGGPGRAGEQPT